MMMIGRIDLKKNFFYVFFILVTFLNVFLIFQTFLLFLKKRWQSSEHLQEFEIQWVHKQQNTVSSN